MQFSFALPYKGFLNFAPLMYKAWYYTAFLTPEFYGGYVPAVASGKANMQPTWAIEANYYMDLGFLPEYFPLAISGRLNLIGGMGPWTSPNLIPLEYLPPSKPEINSEPLRLTFDAGKVFWGPKYSHYFNVWVAYIYRQNLYGLDHIGTSLCAGDTCTVSSLYAGITAKF
jgi:hypothetical protein